MKVTLFFLSFILGFISLLSCQSQKLTPASIEVERQAFIANPKISGFKDDVFQLTSLGENVDPMFSPDGNHILFVSRRRPSHQQGEVYELNLVEKKERRLTFQDGEVYNPIYLAPKKILFLSTTDEIKESPEAIRKQYKMPASPELFPGFLLDRTEIYLKNLDTDDIRRLTEHPGFDGFPLLFGPERLFYQAYQNGELLPVFLSLKNMRPQVQPQFGKNMAFVAYSESQGRLAWAEFNSQGTSQIKTRDHKRDVVSWLTQRPGVYRDLSWHPTEPILFFSSDWARRGQFLIYQFNLTNQCLRSLFPSTFSLVQPRLSPRMKDMAFVMTYAERTQLFLSPYRPERSDCL